MELEKEFREHNIKVETVHTNPNSLSSKETSTYTCSKCGNKVKINETEGVGFFPYCANDPKKKIINRNMNP